MHDLLGLAVSPDDCFLALRGMQTLGIRLAVLERSAFRAAEWLATCHAVATVLHPALSWGGVTSLALPWFDLQRSHGTPYGDRLVRLNIGLEDADDLIADLDQALHRAGLAGPAETRRSRAKPGARAAGGEIVAMVG